MASTAITTARERQDLGNQALVRPIGGCHTCLHESNFGTSRGLGFAAATTSAVGSGAACALGALQPRDQRPQKREQR